MSVRGEPIPGFPNLVTSLPEFNLARLHTPTEQQKQSITTPALSPSFTFPKISAPQGIGIGGIIIIGIIAFLLLGKKR